MTASERISVRACVRACASVARRGIRQRLHALWKEQEWQQKYNVLIGDGGDIPGHYSEHMASSKFCLVVPGEWMVVRGR